MKSGKFDKEKGRHKENERGDRVGRRKGKGFFHSYGKKKRAARERVRTRKKRKKEKRNGENAELPKNGGEILRDRLKSRIKKPAGSEKNEEKGRDAKKIKPRKTMI